MKQVTMESVKERIARIENGASATKMTGIGLRLQHEFELACLRELVAVTDQVRQLTEQRDALVAESSFLMHRIDWPKEQCPTTGNVTDVDPADFIPATSAILDSLRAEAKADVLDEMAATYRGWANEDACSCNMKSSYNLTAERAENYAAYVRRQLRESKGANHE